MGQRFVDIASQPARVSYENRNLVIRSGDAALARVPVAELAALILSHPQITISHPALAALAEAGVPVVCSDAKRKPIGLLLPLVGNALQSERFAAQAAAKKPTQKRLWQQLIRAKLTAQATVLNELRGDDSGLSAMSDEVRSGDPENLEAQAARRYWAALFGEHNFRRHEDDGINALLNYGYAILRSLCARGIAGAGLHPSLGLHHHNRHNPMCLADDLMEPYRPLVDRVVAAQIATSPGEPGLTPETKRALIALSQASLPGKPHRETLQRWTQKTAQSLVAVYLGERRTLSLPTSWRAEAGAQP